MIRCLFKNSPMLFFVIGSFFTTTVKAQLSAGIAKEDITDYNSKPFNDPLFAKALAFDDGKNKFVIITLDVVAVEGIGPLAGTNYLKAVMDGLVTTLDRKNILVNVSHCHGTVRKDAAELTIKAVKNAFENMGKVKIGVGYTEEHRVSEIRRYLMRDGSQGDVRRAYSLPPDSLIQSMRKIDPEVQILRLDLMNSKPLAVLYNFAVHPIQGVPSGGNTADLVGFASKVVEDNTGAMAFFLQGAAGDVNPVHYKDVDVSNDAETLGNILGLTILNAYKQIKPEKISSALKVVNDTLKLPRSDFDKRIKILKEKETNLINSFKGADLDLKTFLSLYNKYKISDEYPSFYIQEYLKDDQIGRKNSTNLDALNRDRLENYIDNIYTMEALTRVKTNLNLVEKHKKLSQGEKTITVELLGLKIGDVRVITFPGELTTEVGLNIKKRSPFAHTLVSAYTNGYIYYCPSARQLENSGEAQEDCDTVLAPEWEDLFYKKIDKLLTVLK